MRAQSSAAEPAKEIPAENAKPAPVVMDKMVINENKTKASAGFAERTAGDSLKETVTGAALLQNGAQNASDSLKGVSGVSVSRAPDGSNSISIRGLAPQFNRVSVDGQRQTNSGRFAGGTNLDSLPPEILKSIEVTKALTPDMDADAIGGVINLSTSSAADLKQGFFQVKEQLVLDSFSDRPGSRTSVSLGRPFRLWTDKADSGIVATFSYDDVYRTREGIETFDDWPSILSPGPAPWTNVFVPTLTNINIEHTTDHRERGTALFNVDTRLGNSAIFFKSNYTHDAQYRARSQNDFDAKLGTALALTPDYGVFGGAHLKHHGVERDASREVATALLGAKTDSENLHLSGSVGATRTEEREPGSIDAIFASHGLVTGTYDTRPSRLSPIVSISDASNSLEGNEVLFEPAKYDFEQLVLNKSLAKDTTSFGQGDLRIDLDHQTAPSFVKFGVKVQHFDRSVNQTRSVYDPNSAVIPFTMANLVGAPTVTFQHGGYQYGPVPNPQAISNLLVTQPGLFQVNQIDTALGSNATNYTAQETIWAAYGMGKYVWQNWSLLGGVRVEGTRVGTRANRPAFSSDGSLLGFTPVTGEKSYVDVLPGIHLRYTPETSLVLRGSVNRSLTRPNYGDLAPFLDINFPTGRARTGNPDLKPYEATNFDTSVDYYRESAGLFTAGLFYKTIRNFQIDSVTLVQLGQAGIFTQSQRINGSTATVEGAELAWKSRPWNLSRVASNVNVGLTYTFTRSHSRLPDRPGENVPLPQQAEHQFSVTVHAEHGKLSSDVNITYHAEMLDNVVASGLDHYEAGVMNVDLSLSYKWSKHLNFLAAARNITDAPGRTYDGSHLRLKETEFFGTEFTFGVNWKM